MENTLSQQDDIIKYIRKNWQEYGGQTFDKVKELTKDTIQWPQDKNELNKFGSWFRKEKMHIKKKMVTPGSAFDKNEQAQKIFVKEEGNILQALAKLMTCDARVDFLKEQVHRNFVVMLDLMKAIQLAPYPTFLEELFDLCLGLEDTHSQVLLFIRICALYSDEQIDVDQDLVKRTLVELSDEALDSNAAYGLLKLAYHNEVSFDQLPINTLLAFEKQYLLEIQAFIRSLHGKIDFQIAQSLPDTCLIFTQPFFKILQNGGKLLHEGVQPCYLIHFVEMVSYAFETQYSLVQDLVDLFKAGCIAIYGRGYDLQPLLQRVIEEEIAQNRLYFGSLSNQIKLFTQVFSLIKESKIPKHLDEQAISELILLDQSTYILRRKQHKDMGAVNLKENFTKYCQALQKENQSHELLIPFPNNEVINIVSNIFKRFNLPNLNQIQLASLSMMEQQQKVFQIFGTGTGKTTLALSYMLKLAKIDNLKCLYVNDVPELCSRDFSRIAVVAQDMDVKVAFLHTEDDLQLIKMNQLVFLSSSLFQQLTKHKELRHTVQDSVLILDEFDLTLFAQDIDQLQFYSFTIPKKIAAFTGSPLEQVHKNLIKHYFKMVPLNYPTFDKISGVSNLCLHQEVFNTRKLQLDALTEFCCKQRKTTPVLVIVEQEAIKSFETLCKKEKVPVIDFNGMTSNQIMAFLDSTFIQNINGAYSICILNAKQGRGLDVPSCSTIENAGGITTVIAQLPTSPQEFVQFKGRTNRMGNKGQHCVILWSKDKTSLTGDLFVQYHLETVRNQEIARLNNLFTQKQDIVEEQKQEQVLKQVKIAEEGLIVMLPRDDLKEFEKLNPDKQTQQAQEVQDVAVQLHETQLELKLNEGPKQTVVGYTYKVSGKRGVRTTAPKPEKRENKRQRIVE